MNHLQEAKQLAVQPGQAAQERAQTYAAIALVEAVHDLTKKVVTLVSKVNALVQQAEPKTMVAEKKVPAKRKAPAKAPAVK